MGKRFWQIFFFSLLAGILTNEAYIAGCYGKFFYPSFFLDFYQLALWQILVVNMIGVISGAFLSLWAYFCLWDKKLVIILPILLFFGPATTALMTIIDPHYLKINTVYGSYFSWILILFLAKFFAPKLTNP